MCEIRVYSLSVNASGSSEMLWQGEREWERGRVVWEQKRENGNRDTIGEGLFFLPSRSIGISQSAMYE